VRKPKNHPERFCDHPALWGFMEKDEPNTSEFAQLRGAVDSLRASCPGRLTFINLLPNYANAGQLGAQSYKEYVKQFLDVVEPDVLCMDHYPMMTPDHDGRERYCDNLRVFRRLALQKGIPFWNFFNTMPYGPQFDPTEAQLRWQVYTSLAYGAKGVLYFCYWTPRGGEFPKGGAILTPEGEKTRHYDQAQRINAALKNLGPTLMQLTSEEVVRVARGDDPTTTLVNTPIRSITPGDYLVGVFRHADGRRAVLLNNYDFTYTAWPTVAFDVDDGKVVEVDPRTGEEVAAIDNSPDMEGLQLSLDAGDGRLFLLPAEAGERTE